MAHIGLQIRSDCLLGVGNEVQILRMLRMIINIYSKVTQNNLVQMFGFIMCPII